MSRIFLGLSRLIVIVLVFSLFAFGHEGFQVRLQDADVDGYTVTVLDDIHENGSGLVGVFVEIDGSPAPKDTAVSVKLKPFGGEAFDFIRADYRGSPFYLERQRAMYMALPLILVQADTYQLQVYLSGKAGQTEISLDLSLNTEVLE